MLATLYLDETLGVTDVLERGVLLSLSGVLALPLLPIIGSATSTGPTVPNPAKALALVGVLILPSALFTPLQFSTHSKALFVVLGVPQAVLITCAFAMVTPVLQAVIPYRLRGMGAAMSTMYIFFIGGFLGGLLSGFLTDEIGVRGAVIFMGVPSAVIGGLMLMNGARFIRHDLSLVVEELLEEQEEHHKRHDEAVAVPALQLANIDFSYGPVQVLFGVNFEVQKGETVALLGTNGAGKSTVLRVISGLGVPERGVVRLNGQNITYVAPETALAGSGSWSCPAGRVCSPPDRPAEPGRSAPVSTRRSTARSTSASRTSSSCSPSSSSAAGGWRAASPVASSRCSRSAACCSTSPRSS